MFKSDYETANDSLQFIIFNLKQQKYGINVMDSREIINFSELTIIPDSPEFVNGVINLRDEIIPIVDMLKKFNIEDEGKEKNKIIIIAVNNNLIGLAVNEVKEILRINFQDISDPPEITKDIKKNYIEGIARINDELLILLDVHNIFSQQEMELIQEIETE